VRPRILINLGAFALLGILLVIWAFTSIITVDVIRQPFHVSAEFESSPGLRNDLEVSYLGVRVGSVSSVKLSTGKVIVGLSLDRGTKVPSNAKAAVLRKSAVGEPYIEMEPDSAVPAAPALKAGDVIPLSRTRVAVEYKYLFKSVGKLLEAVRPEDAQVLTHELAVGLEGRGQTLHDLIGDAHQLTGTLADNASLLDSLATELTALSGTLAEGGPDLKNGLNGLAEFTAGLKDSRTQLDSILNNGPGFLTNVGTLLDKSRPGLSCLLTALGTPAPKVFTPGASKRLKHALEVIDKQFPKLVKDVIYHGKQGDYARVTIAISMMAPPREALQYNEPRTGAKPPPTYSCVAADQAEANKAKTPQKATAAPSADPSALKVNDQFAPVTAVPTNRAVPASEKSLIGTWMPVIPIVLAAVVLTGTARQTLVVVRRRRSPRN
jgi:phospholipid/cholesterol/gamma-HCH transport system substrate-binding protein